MKNKHVDRRYARGRRVQGLKLLQVCRILGVRSVRAATNMPRMRHVRFQRMGIKR